MDQLIVKDALAAFYKTYRLAPDGGIQDSTVKVELLKGVFMYIPNFKARKKVLLKHDIHHLLTGYSAKMKGETAISAWELSTGCTHNWFAFMINTYGMITGLPFNIRGIWKAWLRGRHSKNLYHHKYSNEQFMLQKVVALKKELGLSEENRQKTSVFLALLTFTGFVVFGVVFSLVSVVLIPVTVVYSLFIAVQKLR